MLKIHSVQPAFKGIEQYDEEFNEYKKNYSELEDSKDEFIKLANDENFKMPKLAKQALEGGAIVTTGLLGGMASGWGAKKSLQGFKKLSNTQVVKDIKNHAKVTKDFSIKAAKNLKADFLKSEAYTIPANSIKNKVDKFSNTKVGKPIVKLFNYINKGIKFAFKTIKKTFEYIYKKITGIDKAKAEKAAVNTVGVSGGIASGVTAIKEKQSGDNNGSNT